MVTFTQIVRTLALGIAILGLALRLLHWPGGSATLMIGIWLMWGSIALSVITLWLHRAQTGYIEIIRSLTGQLSMVLLIQGAAMRWVRGYGSMTFLIVGAACGLISTVLAYIPANPPTDKTEKLIEEIGKEEDA